jgi:hypothetical protein
MPRLQPMPTHWFVFVYIRAHLHCRRAARTPRDESHLQLYRTHTCGPTSLPYRYRALRPRAAPTREAGAKKIPERLEPFHCMAFQRLRTAPVSSAGGRMQLFCWQAWTRPSSQAGVACALPGGAPTARWKICGRTCSQCGPRTVWTGPQTVWTAGQEGGERGKEHREEAWHRFG